MRVHRVRTLLGVSRNLKRSRVDLIKVLDTASAFITVTSVEMVVKDFVFIKIKDIQKILIVLNQIVLGR